MGTGLNDRGFDTTGNPTSDNLGLKNAFTDGPHHADVLAEKAPFKGKGNYARSGTQGAGAPQAAKGFKPEDDAPANFSLKNEFKTAARGHNLARKRGFKTQAHDARQSTAQRD